ncbi:MULTISPECIES: efflux RND transporter periplasmic adaptor subunit [Halomonadaceae]|jgi:RND family efflux transporter MFP subunit|uniref:efflux RND transporter periplasmic adaptor subunit n=1 Tax=Halomonadaceae TaxID=28256 RepID=UPI0012F3E297|nr:MULTISPECIES: efflux RND transporter periplasmic adaptor subunit [Halomonas]CAD5259360.1 Multidrug resistance protein mdtA [Halomonas sp. 59]CAD5259649.1 Multidrug resistance protein mdtA [Halomonas sp. 113]CAD5273608.1 Multidrug resistance protein mdtA [Halomonas sp. I3]CAD5289077.1 Multidrug resistance protein mdtA [Halomonas sp. 156]VXB35415.1 Multidrug resistance protein mdtA [Halomonas titanicae]
MGTPLKTSWNHRFRGTLAALLMVGATLATVFSLSSQHSSAQQARQQGADNALLQVSTKALEQAEQLQRDVRLTGRVVARQSVSLAFEPAGRVSAVSADRGDAVAQGDVLATLDTRRLESRLAEVAARSEEARASLVLAQRQEEREAQLNQNNFASRTALDQARTDRLTLQARLAALAAERDSLTADLDDSTLKAPFGGRVIERHVSVGSLVSSGTTAFDLIDVEQLEAHLGLPAALAATFTPGEVVELMVNGEEVSGKVRARLPQVDSDSRTQTLVVSLETPDHAVPGDLAELRYKITEPANGYWVPLDSLQAADRGLWNVLVAEPLENDHYRVAQASVELLHSEGDQAFVRGTLASGMRLITGGTHRVTPGQQVTLSEEVAYEAP